MRWRAIEIKSKLREEGVQALIKNAPKYSARAIRSYVWHLRLRYGYASVGGTKLKLGTALRPSMISVVNSDLELAERALVQELPKSIPVVELGAGIGLVSTELNKHLEQGVEQIAVEIDPLLSEPLRNTRSLNECDFEILISGYHPTQKNLPISRAGGYIYTEISESGDETVPGINLSEIIDRYRLDEFVLVSDIEGGEVGLLEEWNLIENKCKAALIEFHKNTQEVRTRFNESEVFSEAARVGDVYYFTNG